MGTYDFRFAICDLRLLIIVREYSRVLSFAFKSQIANRKSAIALLGVALFAFAVHVEAGAGSVAVVRVRLETVAQGEQLTLGDIADIRTTDSHTSQRLSSIALGYAPGVGALREITRERIVLAVSAAGFADGTVQLEAPPIALVRRAAQTVDPLLIHEAADHTTLLAELRATGATARLVRLDLPPVLEVPTGALEVRASTGGIRSFFTPFIMSIELWVDGRIAKRLSATAQVEAMLSVLVATRDLAANSPVSEADTKLEARRLERAASSYVRDAARLRGMVVRGAIARGEAITLDSLVASIVVRPGDAVRIIGASRTVSVTVAGEARAAGRIGDRIQVKNLQSGVVLQAVVVEEGVVRVRF